MNTEDRDLITKAINQLTTEGCCVSPASIAHLIQREYGKKISVEKVYQEFVRIMSRYK